MILSYMRAQRLFKFGSNRQTCLLSPLGTALRLYEVYASHSRKATKTLGTHEHITCGSNGWLLQDTIRDEVLRVWQGVVSTHSEVQTTGDGLSRPMRPKVSLSLAPDAKKNL